VEVISVDPMYEHTPTKLEIFGRQDIHSAMHKLRNSPDRYPGYSEKASIIEQTRMRNLNRFLDDFKQGKDEKRYIHAMLPSLPFEDNSFDVSLCGFLLFVYAPVYAGGLMDNDMFDYDWHFNAVKELMRVTKDEIRIYPAFSFLPKDKQAGPYNAYAQQILETFTATKEAKCSFYQSKYSRVPNDFGLLIQKNKDRK
jgi:hypothetical protein